MYTVCHQHIGMYLNIVFLCSPTQILQIALIIRHSIKAELPVIPSLNDVLRYARQGKTWLACSLPPPCESGLVMYSYISKNCDLTPIIILFRFFIDLWPIQLSLTRALLQRLHFS